MQVKRKALRLVLADAAALAAHEALQITGRSINDLPEYFLSVSIARFVQQHYKTLTFSMEDSVRSICDKMEIDGSFIQRPGNVDITVRPQSKPKRIKHIIELKRSYGIKGHYADIERLADFCMAASAGDWLETNYMVLMTAASKKAVKLRESQLNEYVKDTYHGKIELKRESVKLDTTMRSTRKGSTNGKQLSGEIWEVRYVG